MADMVSGIDGSALGTLRGIEAGFRHGLNERIDGGGDGDGDRLFARMLPAGARHCNAAAAQQPLSAADQARLVGLLVFLSAMLARARLTALPAMNLPAGAQAVAMRGPGDAVFQRSPRRLRAARPPEPDTSEDDDDRPAHGQARRLSASAERRQLAVQTAAASSLPAKRFEAHCAQLAEQAGYRVKQFNKVVKDGANTIGEIDVGLKGGAAPLPGKVVVEATLGTGGKGKQVRRYLENPRFNRTGGPLTVVLYAPHYRYDNPYAPVENPDDFARLGVFHCRTDREYVQALHIAAQRNARAQANAISAQPGIQRGLQDIDDGAGAHHEQGGV